MNVKEIEKLESELQKKGILTSNEINQLIFYLTEVFGKCNKVQEIILNRLMKASRKDDPLKIGEELIDYDILAEDFIDYLKDFRKIVDKITDRLYNKYSEKE